MKKLIFMFLSFFVLFLNEAHAGPISGGPVGGGGAGGVGADATMHYLTTQAEAALLNETVTSANGLAIATAPTYAAMRALLDLEAGSRHRGRLLRQSQRLRSSRHLPVQVSNDLPKRCRHRHGSYPMNAMWRHRVWQRWKPPPSPTH